jgi:protocatechuate 3,4-dioxygenase beta subunit
MIRWLVVGVCCVVFAASSLGQSDAPREEQKQSVQGKVVDAKSGQPIRKVNVEADGGADQSYGQHVTTTGADGTFTIEDLAPGRYRVTLLRPGFAQTATSRGQATFTLQPGQSFTGLVLRMQAAGVISGKIVDADGDPMAGVGVSAQVTGVQSGCVIM